MFNHNLTTTVLTRRVMNSIAAGTTTSAGSSVNLASGGTAVRFIALLGALTASQTTSLKAQQSSDNGSADDFSDIIGSSTGNMADADSNKMLVLDVYRPQKQYIRPFLTRGTANAVVDGIIAEVYNLEDNPPAVHSTVSQQKVIGNVGEGAA